MFRLSSNLKLETIPEIPNNMEHTHLWRVVLHYDPKVIAEQLTILDKRLYNSVEFSYVTFLTISLFFTCLCLISFVGLLFLNLLTSYQGTISPILE